MRALGLRLGAGRFSPLRLLPLVLLGAFNTASALETGMKPDGNDGREDRVG
ncbi:MAG: hypothetical protein OET79_15135 [Nitrospirota bacterium]|nr:hypothetical protein [Nitrospirota bacterium]